MKDFFGQTVRYLLWSFLTSFIICCFTASLSSDNFTQSILPEAKHRVSYHFRQLSTPAATASGTSTEKISKTSNGSPSNQDAPPCLFLIIWGLLFFYLLFAKYSGLIDTGYICPIRVLYYRKRGDRSDWGE